MRKYYYSVGGTRVGPVTIEELKVVRGLTSETLVWYEGLSTWIRAGDIAELSDVFYTAPSPVPRVVGDGRRYTPPMTPGRGEQKMFAAPFSFEGRISRSEYIYSFIISIVFFIVSDLYGMYRSLSFLAEDPGYFSWEFYWIYFLVRLLMVSVISCCFNFAQGAKRCHDIGKSGWMQLIPYYTWYLTCAEGNRGENEYGPDPKGA